MPEKFKKINLLFLLCSLAILCACSVPGDDGERKIGNNPNFRVDTVINGIHTQQNGRIPTKEDFKNMFTVEKKYVDSFIAMTPADKDSLIEAYKRSFNPATQ